MRSVVSQREVANKFTEGIDGMRSGSRKLQQTDLAYISVFAKCFYSPVS